MSASVTYGFITSSRRGAPSICSRIACDAATWPPGITCASAIGVEPSSSGAGKYAERSAPTGRRARGKLVRNAACACRTTAPVTHHHVVEAAVPEVVLDPRSAGPGDGAVDHVELAVVGAAHSSWRQSMLAVGKEAVAVEREDVVDDDLGAGFGEPREHLACLLVRPRAEAVHDHPHLDALVELAPEERGHLHPDLALTPAEHEDVHGGFGRFDVREDPREEGRPRPAARSSRRSTRRTAAPHRAGARRRGRRTPRSPPARRRR